MKTIPLGEIMRSRAGSVTPANFPEEVFELFSIPAHDRGGSEKAIGQTIRSSKQSVRPNDVLLSKIVPHIRRARVVGEKSDYRQIASGEWMIFSDPRVAPEYMRHFFLSNLFHTQLMGTVAGVGGSLLRARPEHVKRIEIPLPPLEEQRRIAAILDRADALRAKRRQVLAQLDLLQQSIFVRLFGEPSTWFDRWTLGSIGDLVESTQYGTSTKAGAVGEWPVLRMGNVTDAGRLNLDDLKYLDLLAPQSPKYTVRRGDLLFNRTNSPEKVGKCCVVETDRPLAFAGYLVRVRFTNPASAYFVSAYLTSRHGRAVRRGRAKAAVNQANINPTELKSISIAHPPKELIDAFAMQVKSIGQHRTLIERDLTVAEDLFAALQSRAFRGEL